MKKEKMNKKDFIERYKSNREKQINEFAKNGGDPVVVIKAQSDLARDLIDLGRV